MAASTTSRHYKSTESKYKGGAREMYVTYDMSRATRSGKATSVPRVKRVYIAGKVKDWNIGNYAKRTGKRVHGVKIEYEQSRAAYNRKPYSARRKTTAYKVSGAHVGAGETKFVAVVEVPKDARNIHFYPNRLPHKYASTLQHVR